MNPDISKFIKWGALAAVAGGLLWVGFLYMQWQRDRMEAEVVSRGMRYAVEQITPAYLEYVRTNRKAPDGNAELKLPPARDVLWIGDFPNDDTDRTDTDLALTAAGKIAVTPLHFDLTHKATARRLEAIAGPLSWPKSRPKARTAARSGGRK